MGSQRWVGQEGTSQVTQKEWWAHRRGEREEVEFIKLAEPQFLIPRARRELRGTQPKAVLSLGTGDSLPAQTSRGRTKGYLQVVKHV